jgi:hypothetical protein
LSDDAHRIRQDLDLMARAYDVHSDNQGFEIETRIVYALTAERLRRILNPRPTADVERSRVIDLESQSTDE